MSWWSDQNGPAAAKLTIAYATLSPIEAIDSPRRCDSSNEPSTKHTIATPTATTACFGYTTDGARLLSDVKEGDVIVSAKVVDGLDRLVRPSS